jgi:hypothetical protein
MEDTSLDAAAAEMAADATAAFAMDQAKASSLGKDLPPEARPFYELGFGAGAAWVLQKMGVK